MATYHDRLLALLADEIVAAIAVAKTKQTYVIHAIKKAIAGGKVEQLRAPGEKNLFAGRHRFRLVVAPTAQTLTVPTAPAPYSPSESPSLK